MKTRFPILLLIILVSCTKQTAEFSVPIRCIEEYDKIEVQIEGDNGKVDRSLDVTNDVVDFETLEEGNYEVTALVYRSEFEDPVVNYVRRFSIPTGSNYSNLLNIPNPVEVDSISIVHEDFSSTALLTLSSDCSEGASLYYAYSTDSASLFDVDEWILFGENYYGEQKLEIPMEEDEMYFTFRSEYESDGESYSTRSNVFSSDITSTPYAQIKVGERHGFSTLEGDAYFIRVPVTEGSVYVVDLFDSANDPALTSVNTSLNVIDYYSDMRVYNDSDSRRILHAESDVLLIEAVNAFPGEFGTAEILIREVDISTPIEWNDSISWNFQSNDEISVTKTTVEAGEQDWIYTPQRGEEDQYIWLYTVVLDDNYLGEGIRTRFGPLGFGDEDARTYSANPINSGEVYIIATPSYFGEPTSASLSIQSE